MAKKTEIYLSKGDMDFLMANAKEKHQAGYIIRRIKLFGTWIPCWVNELDWLMKVYHWVEVFFYTKDGKNVTIRAMRGALRTMEEFPDATT
jgi:hypothetical protein